MANTLTFQQKNKLCVYKEQHLDTDLRIWRLYASKNSVKPLAKAKISRILAATKAGKTQTVHNKDNREVKRIREAKSCSGNTGLPF